MKNPKFLILTLPALLLFSCSKVQVSPNANSPGTAAVLKTQATPTNQGTLADKNIKYFGRWDFSNPAQFVSYWGGAYIKVNFTGTTVKMKTSYGSNFYSKIDDGPWKSYIGVIGVVDLTPVALSNGKHSLIVAQGKDYDYVFNFQGLVLDSGAITSPPVVSSTLVEYIGDSITAGYTDPQANVSCYAWVCSESLGVEHTQIAYPGIRLVSSEATGMDVQYFRQRSPGDPSTAPWNFAYYSPKAVVINLGTNDNGHVPEATFQNSYVAFLGKIRAKFPNAEIIVLRTFLGVTANETAAAVAARITAGDQRVHYVDTDGWLVFGTSDYTDGLHPSVEGNIKAANLLKPILSTYLSGGVTFYQDTQYQGPASKILPIGNYTLSQLNARGMQNEWASSVRVPFGRKLIMYADDNFRGRSWTITSDTPDFTKLKPTANDVISSIRIQ